MNTVLKFFYFLTISILGFYWNLICSAASFVRLFLFQVRILPSITAVKIRNLIRGQSPPVPPPRPRKLPLHTSALSLLSIIDRFCVKSQEFDGPIPSLLRNFADLQTEPYVRGIKLRLLSLLTKADDRIMAYEYATEGSLPFLQHVFNKIDGLVRCAEAVPDKVDKLFVFVNEVPILKLLFSCALSWLEFWVAVVLAFREWKNVEKGGPVQKDITLDAIAASTIGESEYADKFEHF